jgi:acetyl esterase/lipase
LTTRPTGGSRANRFVRAVLVAAAIVALAPVLVVLLGAFLPGLPYIGRFDVFAIEFLHILLGLSLLAAGLAIAAILLGGRRWTMVLLAISAVAILGNAVIYNGLQFSALVSGGAYSPFRQIGIDPALKMTGPNRTIVYATVDGQDLHAQIWFPFGVQLQPLTGSELEEIPRPVVVFFHGGGFTGGDLGTRPTLFNAMAHRGYLIIDAEYRLSPPPRWQDAPGDALCAIGWAQAHAADLGADPRRIVVMGESAGGNLALVAGWSAGTKLTASSCELPTKTLAAVIAISPAADLAGVWEDNTLSQGGVRFPEAYIGGPPSQFPDRYAAASPDRLVSSGLPPTLILVAGNDHLVAPNRSTYLVPLVQRTGAQIQYIVVPFADHAFDNAPNAFGEQLEETLFPRFIEAHA